MSTTIRFMPPRVQMVDGDGMITRQWYLFLQGVFDRIGGATGESVADLADNMAQATGVAEGNAALFAVDQTFAQLPPAQAPLDQDLLLAEVAELRAQVAEMSKELDSLRQGVSI